MYQYIWDRPHTPPQVLIVSRSLFLLHQVHPAHWYPAFAAAKFAPAYYSPIALSCCCPRDATRHFAPHWYFPHTTLFLVLLYNPSRLAPVLYCPAYRSSNWSLSCYVPLIAHNLLLSVATSTNTAIVNFKCVHRPSPSHVRHISEDGSTPLL